LKLEEEELLREAMRITGKGGLENKSRDMWDMLHDFFVILIF